MRYKISRQNAFDVSALGLRLVAEEGKLKLPSGRLVDEAPKEILFFGRTLELQHVDSQGDGVLQAIYS